MHIGLISVPLDESKKIQDRLFPFAASLNYGLLSLATHIARYGFVAKVFGPVGWENGGAVELILTWIQKNHPQCVGLSCISGFSYPAFKILAHEIKKSFPDLPLIAGGKDHVGLIAEKVMDECPEIDVIIQGEGEIPLVSILERFLPDHNFNSLIDIPNVMVRNGNTINVPSSVDRTSVISELQSFDYTLYEDFKLRPPCIEVGRGCSYGCHFCSNDRKKVLRKFPSAIVAEAEELTRLFGMEDLSLYFQAPMLLMQDDELKLLGELRKAKNLLFQWRAQTRVDYLTPAKIRLMANAGAKVLDLGFESGSCEMLLRMNKCNNPVEYLAATGEALRTSYEVGIIIKLNILFYAGERRETLLDTFNFLEKYSVYCSWTISAYPLLVYPGTTLGKEISSLLEENAGSLVQTEAWRERHLTPVNPSQEFTYEDMQQIGILFGKAFQTCELYFKERRHGYYRPGVTFSDFLQKANEIGFVNLPCSKNEKDMLKNRKLLRELLETPAHKDWRYECGSL